MTEKVTELSEEQRALIPLYRERWIDVGLSTERVDFEKAKEALYLAYDCSDQARPNRVDFALGPADAIRLGLAYNELERKEAAAAGAPLPDKVTAKDILEATSYGCQEAGWLSFYNYFEEVCGIEFPMLKGLNALAFDSGWVTTFDTWACIHDRPLYIKLDENDRLHGETGPAVEYKDGTKIYVWHGVSVPESWIIDKESLDPMKAITWPNIEQRRAAAEIIGWAKILDKLNCNVIDKHENPHIGTLLEADLPGMGKEKFLRVLCGTGRTFAIPVPPEMTTAVKANSWTYGFENGELEDLTIRT